MNYHIEVIEDNPGSVQRAIHGFGPQVVFVAQFVPDFIDDRAQVRLACAGGDHKVIRHGGKLAHIQDNNVFRLLVVR